METRITLKGNPVKSLPCRVEQIRIEKRALLN